MEKSFTQRMDWLHTWFGLVLGWLAFALFLTGTIAVFWFEIQHWAQTELHGAKMLSLEDTVQYSVDYLEKVAPDSRRWAVYAAGPRPPSAAGAELARRERRAAIRAARARRLGNRGHHRHQGGRFFVDFHWTFNRPVHDLTGRHVPVDVHAVGRRGHRVPDLHDHGARRSQEDLPQLLHVPAPSEDPCRHAGSTRTTCSASSPGRSNS